MARRNAWGHWPRSSGTCSNSVGASGFSRGTARPRPAAARAQKRLFAAVFEPVEARLLFSLPPLPVIPSGAGHLFEVTAYGAVGNGSTNDTADIQAAIAYAAELARERFVRLPIGSG